MAPGDPGGSKSSYLWPGRQMHVPELGVGGHLGCAGELVLRGAQEVAALHVAQRPAPAAVLRHAGNKLLLDA